MIKLLFLLFLLPINSFATILFLDTNFSPLEVSAARKAAAKRGEDIVIVPDSYSLSQAERSSIAAAKIKREKLLKIGKTTGFTMQLFAELEENDSKISKYKVTKESLKNAIAKAPGQISTLIVSGHSEGENFNGLLGDTSRHQILNFMTEANRIKELNSVYLWGCYTGTAGTSLSWQLAAPELELILGFETTGPLGESPPSGGMLLKALDLEANLLKESQNKKNLATIKEFNKLDMKHLMGAMINSCHLSVKSNQITPIEDITLGCAELTNELNNIKETLFDPYLNGVKPLKDLETQGNDVRKYYNEVQKNLHCLWRCAPPEKLEVILKAYPDKFSISRAGKVPCPGQLISLIKFPHVFNNYKTVYGSEIEDLKKVLALDSKMSTECKNAFSLNYGPETIRNITKDLKFTCATEASDPAIIPKLKIISDRLRKSLVNMNAIPLSWIEEQVKPEPLKSGKGLDDIDPSNLAPQNLSYVTD